MARSVKARLQMAAGEIVTRPQLRLGWRDWSMLAVLGCATAMAFGSGEWKRRWKVPYQIALIAYVGFIAGDLVAQKLLAGWTRSGVPWSTAPGVVLLVAAALLVPWATRKITLLSDLNHPCEHCHRLKTHHGWDYVPGTGKRPLVPPDDPRHPKNQANAPPGTMAS